jgi:hypothetical protein
VAAISSYARLTEERIIRGDAVTQRVQWFTCHAAQTDRQTEDISVRSGSTGAQLWFQPSLFLVTFFPWHSIAGSVAVGGCKRSPKKNRKKKKLVSLQVQPKRRGRGAEEADGDRSRQAGQALPRPPTPTAGGLHERLSCPQTMPSRSHGGGCGVLMRFRRGRQWSAAAGHDGRGWIYWTPYSMMDLLLGPD